MDEIIEQIAKFKRVLDSDVDLEKFIGLLSHSTDGEVIGMKGHYANVLILEDWVKLYKKANIEVNEEQLLVFFEYLIKYYNKYFEKVHGKMYAVKRGVDFKQREDFRFEKIVYYSVI